MQYPPREVLCLFAPCIAGSPSRKPTDDFAPQSFNQEVDLRAHQHEFIDPARQTTIGAD